MKVFLLGIVPAWWLMSSGFPFVQRPAAIASPVNPGQKFMIFYANDVRGEIDPCG